MEITQKDNGRNGIFLAVEDSENVGEMTYVWANDEKIIIDHTGVDPAYRDGGVGQQLVFKAVEFARNGNIKITPLCSFAKSVFNKNPEIQDVLA